MKITYWADFECPFCYIGVTRMENLIHKLGLEDKVWMEMRAFEVMPENGPHPHQTFAEHIMEWIDGCTEEQADQWIERVASQAMGEGVGCNLKTVPLASTFEAHRIMKYAQHRYGNAIANDLLHKIWYAYFVENLEFSNHEMLLDCAIRAGMDEKETREVLASDRYTDQVYREKEAAETFQIENVPVFFFGKQFLMVGAQPEAVMQKYLLEALANEPD